MTPAPRPAPPDPVALDAYAADHLAYIRRTMERAGAFTAVSGVGQMGAGLVGLAAAVVAGRVDPAAWLAVWLAAAVAASTLASAGIVRKSRRLGVPLFSGPGRNFALGFLPPLVSGAVLTAAVSAWHVPALLPGLWLLLFGAAVLAAGSRSVPPVPLMGACFMALGVVAFVAPASWADWLLGLGFGAVNVVFGIIIAVKYGG